MNTHTLPGMAAILLGAACLLPVGLAAAAEDTATDSDLWLAHLDALNSQVTGRVASGEARIERHGDELTLSVKMAGVPADTEHWQHFHGFTTGTAASCATAADDANGDDIVDVTETERASGTTMVPFDTDPVAMDVPGGTYPVADADGSYTWTQTVSLSALQAAFAKAFPDQTLDFDKRVLYVHGVPADAALPGSVASLGPIPAHVTLPIACGKFGHYVER